MTIDDVLALARAGYTRDEIAALNQPQPQPQPQSTPEWATQLVTAMDTITQRLTALNLGAGQQQQPQSVDAILAEIIAPPMKKK